jgi:hypothetical protein
MSREGYGPLAWSQLRTIGATAVVPGIEDQRESRMMKGIDSLSLANLSAANHESIF